MIRQMLLTSLLVAFALPAAAQNTCDAGKLKCLRNKLSCLIKVNELSQKKGLPPDAAKLQKCMDKFDGGAVPERGCFAKLEAKQDATNPATVCSKTGDTAAAEANVDAYVAGLLSLINATIPSTTTTTTLPVAEVCCDFGPFCGVVDAAGCSAAGGIPHSGSRCGASGSCSTGTSVPGACCDGPVNLAPGVTGSCAEPLDATSCLVVFGGVLTNGAVCEATGCRACLAAGALCASGSECCSKTCLAATLPKKCF